jgi:hypothetical protein
VIGWAGALRRWRGALATALRELSVQPRERSISVPAGLGLVLHSRGRRSRDVPVPPGVTWNFRTWFPDDNPTPTSNFTDAVTVMFR